MGQVNLYRHLGQSESLRVAYKVSKAEAARALSVSRMVAFLCCHYKFLFLSAIVGILLLDLCSADGVPASFVFGDSLVDAGNNNYIVSLSKANFMPNGIDYAPYLHPTGRFTNGRTTADLIGQEFGLANAPPFLAPTTTGAAVLHGVNYASGGGGIFNATGNVFGGRINLDAQLDNFANTRQDIISSIGPFAASKLFRKSIFSVTMGSNDFINNYLTPVVSIPERKFIPPEVFVGAMIARYRLQLTVLRMLILHVATRLEDLED